jgi:hypothetical protein
MVPFLTTIPGTFAFGRTSLRWLHMALPAQGSRRHFKPPFHRFITPMPTPRSSHIPHGGAPQSPTGAIGATTAAAGARPSPGSSPVAKIEGAGLDCNTVCNRRSKIPIRKLSGPAETYTPGGFVLAADKIDTKWNVCCLDGYRPDRSIIYLRIPKRN